MNNVLHSVFFIVLKFDHFAIDPCVRSLMLMLSVEVLPLLVNLFLLILTLASLTVDLANSQNFFPSFDLRT